MVEISAIYKGDKNCELTHGPSGAKISTDAPRDNNGLGRMFSPTDLVGAALISCVLTTMAIVAERDGIEFTNATGKITKEMQPNPRRIASLGMTIHMPAGLDASARKKLEHSAHACPVHKSLHPDTKIPIEFIYPD